MWTLWNDDRIALHSICCVCCRRMQCELSLAQPHSLPHYRCFLYALQWHCCHLMHCHWGRCRQCQRHHSNQHRRITVYWIVHCCCCCRCWCRDCSDMDNDGGYCCYYSPHYHPTRMFLWAWKICLAINQNHRNLLPNRIRCHRRQTPVTGASLLAYADLNTLDSIAIAAVAYVIYTLRLGCALTYGRDCNDCGCDFLSHRVFL